MTPSWYAGPLGSGDEGDAVAIVQRKLRIPVTGVVDLTTEAAIRGYQRGHGLAQTGVVDESTAELLGEKASVGLPPLWYHRCLGEGDVGPDVAALALSLGLPVFTTFTATLTVAVRRFQASVGLPTTGAVNLDTAIAIAARTL